MTHPQDGLPRATPQSRGTDPAVINAVLDALDRDGLELHSLLIWQDGALIAEGYWAPFGPDLPHMMHSATKSFTSMAVGLAVDDGLLGIDDPVMGFFPEHAGRNPDPRLARMTLRHLLTMTSGHGHGISGGAWRRLKTSWIADFLAQPLPHEPGEVFVYDSAASYMLSAIVQRATGRRVHDLLAERIFGPMGLSDALRWDIGPDGVNTGGNGLDCTSRDLLRLGILHLQGGRWNGVQLLSADWVAQATGMQLRDVVLGVFNGETYLGPEAQGDGAPATRREGYGFQWWRGPLGSYSANGLFGQYCIVLPHRQTVVAFTGGLRDSDRRVHDLIHGVLEPALGAGGGTPEAGQRLNRRLAGLAHAHQPQGDAAAPAPADWQGTYLPASNDQGAESLRLDGGAGWIDLHLTDARGSHVIRAGLGQWMQSITTMTGAALHHSYEPDEGLRVAACARWLPPQDGWARLELTWIFVETAFRDTVLCRFRAGRLRLSRSVNVNSSLLSLPDLDAARIPEACQ